MGNNGVKQGQGKVKWFSDAKGYGFLTSEDKTDIFVHFSAIESGDKYRKLAEGDAVEFEASKGPKGWKADRVVVVQAAQ